MRPTNLFEKILPSLINLAAVVLLSIPVVWNQTDIVTKKIYIIFIFFSYNLLFLFFNKNRCLGMMIVGTYWEKDYPLKNKLLWLILYTLSFSTLFFWLFFPFDLFVINLLFLQLPTILTKRTTLHGFLSGQMATVKNS